uniref:Thymidylate kinase n=1 Tax=Rhizophora mucronata TaxID=61149 RepID=A0A2P2J6A5_RHIMU
MKIFYAKFAANFNLTHGELNKLFKKIHCNSPNCKNIFSSQHI